MRQLVGYAGALVVAVAIAPWASAHHGFGTFLMNKDVEITGTVTGLDFVNPHSWLYLDVTQPDGKVAAMRCEMRSATTLRRSGWTPDLFKVGKKITITGSPDRDDPYSCYVSTVIFADGSRVDRYGQLAAPANIGQGQRPVKLANGQPNISGDWAQEQVVMTDPRGQIGTLVPLSQVEEIRKSGNLEARGAIPGARNTEQADAQVEAARRAAAGQQPVAPVAPNRGGGPGRGGAPTNLTAAGRAALAARPVTDRYAQSCVFRSIVAEWGGEPVNRITKGADAITIEYGRGLKRTIYTKVASHPANVTPSRGGHSIGKWDGDTLVVDTVGFTPGIIAGNVPHGAQLHVVERFSLDPATMALKRDYTAEDPATFTDKYAGTDTVLPADAPYADDKCEELTYRNYSLEALENRK